MKNTLRQQRRSDFIADKFVLGETIPMPLERENLSPHALQSDNTRHSHKKACNLYEKQVRYFHSSATGNTGRIKYGKKGIGYNSYTELTPDGQAFTRLNGFEYIKANDPQYALDQESRKQNRQTDKINTAHVLLDSDKKAVILERLALAQQALAKSETISKDHL
jgi:hypothetical protein